MKKFTITLVIAMLLIAVVSLTGCNKSRKIPNAIPTNFDYGSWIGSTYRNDFFGFSITVPNDWHIAGKEDMKAMIQDAQDMDIWNKDELERQKKIAGETTANLFFVARFTDEEAMEKEVFNPNINLTVENVSLPGKQIDQASYVNILRQNLSKALPGLVIKSQTNKTIGSQEFTSLQLQFSIEDVFIFQESLICMKNGYAMLFVMTNIDDSEKQQLDDIMATLKWD